MYLANENFPRPSILLLRENGFNIQSIQEKCPGVSDEKVIEMAVDRGLIILTFDSDYGELIFKYARKNPPAIIYFRDKGKDPLTAANLLMGLLNNPSINVTNAFTIVERDNVRQRFYL